MPPTITIVAQPQRNDGRDWITIAVVDTGLGMTPEQLGKLFQEFSQASSADAPMNGTARDDRAFVGVARQVEQRLPDADLDMMPVRAGNRSRCDCRSSLPSARSSWPRPRSPAQPGRLELSSKVSPVRTSSGSGPRTFTLTGSWADPKANRPQASSGSRPCANPATSVRLFLMACSARRAQPCAISSITAFRSGSVSLEAYAKTL